MIKKIFRSIFLVSIVSFLCAMALLLLVLYGYTRSFFTDEFAQKAKYIGAGVELAGETYLKNVPADTYIIWMGSDGAVLFDSRPASESFRKIDWQQARDAMEDGAGNGVWYVGQTVYCALQLEDGSVLLVCEEQHDAKNIAHNMFVPMLIVFALLLVLSIGPSIVLSKKLFSLSIILI